MFNDNYDLTQAVLEGRKTQTRRLVPKKLFTLQWDVDEDESTLVFENDMGDFIDIRKSRFAHYKVGEVVAIAQSYETIFHAGDCPNDFFVNSSTINKKYCGAGFKNKMFVRADLMPHSIRITDVRVERIQEISDGDCIAEGVVRIEHVIPTPTPEKVSPQYYPCQYLKDCAKKVGWGRVYDTPQKAYAALIDKISGRGTWQSNPYVFVYEFELVD